VINKNTLLLFTHSFPYGTGESFLETEIVLLASHYEKVVIAPLVKASSDHRIIPDNVELLDISGILEKHYERNFIKKLKLIVYVFSFQFIHSKRKGTYFKQFRYYLSYLIHKINVANELHRIILQKKYDSVVCYSYWFDYLILPLSILRKEKKINYLLTRAHGGDVYEYQHEEPNFFFSFRSFQIQNIDTICPISQDGLAHLKTNYPLSINKLKLSRLGVVATGKINNSPVDNTVIVTCSSFFGYKRLNLVPEILKHLSVKVKWIHIGGDGDLKDEIMKLAKLLPENIEAIFKGQLSNSQVFEFYETTPVSLFLNVSKSEGLPVSIMEAISFGIPVIATDVGGVKEIVTNQTGNLLDLNFDPKYAARLIEDNLTKYSSAEFRSGVRAFWENNFNAEKNYSYFITNILSD